MAKTLIFLIFLACLLPGCAHEAKTVGPVFFPPPPEEPHVQYLMGISNSTDLQKQGRFSSLITGGTVVVTKLSKPYGLTESKGKIYICDIGAGQIVVVDFINKTMKNLVDELGSGQLKKPIGVAVDEDGYVYVADNGRKDIAVYTPAGKFVKAYAKDLQRSSLVGVAVYKGYLFALDSRQSKIFVLDRKTGELLSTIGENPDKTKNMALPNGLAVDPKGNIFVVNMGNGTVKEYDLDGHMLSGFGRLGDSPGQFTRPRGIAVDDEGKVFVVDAGFNVAQVFDEKHRVLGYFGQSGLPAGSMNLPAGIIVSKENLDYFQKFAAPGFKLSQVVFVTNQYSSPVNSNLAVYGIGEMEGAKKEQAPAKGTSGAQQGLPEGKNKEAGPKGKTGTSTVGTTEKQ